MDMTNDDVVKILSIVDESGYNDVYLEIGDLKLHVQKQGSSSHGVPHTVIDSPGQRRLSCPSLHS